MIDIAAPIPPSLREADRLLHEYGQWAKDRPRLYGCGSIERNYVPTKGEAFEIRREPRPVYLHIDVAMRCQRALTRVPEKERVVLTILYVPQRRPAIALMRMARIPPRLSQERHLDGLRMFNNIFGTIG